MAPAPRRNQGHNNDDAELLAYMSEDDLEEIAAQTAREEPTPEEERAGETAKCVVLMNLPIVGADKVERLKERLAELTQPCDISRDPKPVRVFIPMNKEGSSMGFAFVAYGRQEATFVALDVLNGQKFGKNELSVVLYTTLEETAMVPKEFVPPPKLAYTDPVDAESWLEDGRDQFALRYGPETVINWVEPLSLGAATQVAYNGEREKGEGRQWTRKYVQWSPKGTYFVTFHDQGCRLWGGLSFTAAPNGRIPHAGVTHASFSPCERYLITWDGTEARNKDALVIWDVKTAQRLKTFEVKEGTGEWPIMKWSGDGSYFARQIENGISVFETPSMKLLGGKAVACKSIASFEWSPSARPGEHLLTYWAPEVGDSPARFVLFDPVNRKELRAKNLVNVDSVKLHWHPVRGDFACAQVLRRSKTGKVHFTNFEFFRMRDANYPNETLNVSDDVEAFAFEPGPSVPVQRFAVAHTANEGKQIDVTFYSLGATKGGTKLEKLFSVANKQCNHLSFSPQGGVVVLAGLESMNGRLDFFDIDERVTTGTSDHYMCNEVLWDPSGRIVATCVTQPLFASASTRFTLDNGYRFYSFQGTMLKETKLNEFYQFVWRPRPKCLLSDAELEDLKKKYPQHAKRFEKEDLLLKKRREAAANAGRIQALQEFRQMMAERRKEYEESGLKERRARLGVFAKCDEQRDPADFLEVVEQVEELLSEKMELLS